MKKRVNYFLANFIDKKQPVVYYLQTGKMKSLYLFQRTTLRDVRTTRFTLTPNLTASNFNLKNIFATLIDLNTRNTTPYLSSVVLFSSQLFSQE